LIAETKRGKIAASFRYEAPKHGGKGGGKKDITSNTRIKNTNKRSYGAQHILIFMRWRRYDWGRERGIHFSKQGGEGGGETNGLPSFGPGERALNYSGGRGTRSRRRHRSGKRTYTNHNAK